jgi:antitoxin PrlF
MRDCPSTRVTDDDPALGLFLDLLDRDIDQHPERMVPVTAAFVQRVRKATAGVEVDPHAPIDGPVAL